MTHIILSDAWLIDHHYYVTINNAYCIPFDPLVFDRYRTPKTADCNCDMNGTSDSRAVIRTPQLPKDNFCVGLGREQNIFIRSGIDVSTDCLLFGHISMYGTSAGTFVLKNIEPKIIYCSAFQLKRPGVTSLEVVVKMPAGTSIQLFARSKHEHYVKRYSWSGSALKETISTIG